MKNARFVILVLILSAATFSAFAANGPAPCKAALRAAAGMTPKNYANVSDLAEAWDRAFAVCSEPGAALEDRVIATLKGADRVSDFEALIVVVEREEGFESRLLPDLLDALASRRQLAGLQVEAKQLFERSLSIRENADGSRGKARGLLMLGYYYTYDNQLTQAESYFRKAVEAARIAGIDCGEKVCSVTVPMSALRDAIREQRGRDEEVAALEEEIDELQLQAARARKTKG